MSTDDFVSLYLSEYISNNFKLLLIKNNLCDVIFEVGSNFNKKKYYGIKCLFATELKMNLWYYLLMIFVNYLFIIKN